MVSFKITKVRHLHERYIQGTTRKALVKVERVLVSRLSKSTIKTIESNGSGFECERVYLSTVSLKHIFDTRGAQEYDAILENFERVLEKPDEIYENLQDKRGEFIFIKNISITTFDNNNLQEWILCSLDVKKDGLEVVTTFRFTEERKKRNYLKKYKLLWNWEGDSPPS